VLPNTIKVVSECTELTKPVVQQLLKALITDAQVSIMLERNSLIKALKELSNFTKEESKGGAHSEEHFV
jgi:hypothetical protein